jgi:thymidylate synthase
MTNEEVLMREVFLPLYQKIQNNDFVKDKSGVKIAELIAPRLELDPSQAFLDFGSRKTPIKYAEAELKWYDSCDLSVEFIGKSAQIWNDIASSDGKVNSNYGWCIYSAENNYQYKYAVNELLNNSETRRSCMIYNRPSMQTEYNTNGMNDFMCTFSTQHMIRNKKLIYIVSMRSNDAVYGFFNDFFWHCTVYDRMFKKLQKKFVNLEKGNIIWIANSLHVYEKHFEMLKNICDTH